MILTDIQKEGFATTVRRIKQYNPDYAKAFNLPDTIDKYEDLAKLPFLTKEMLRVGYPFQYLSCDKNQITRMHMSSGTTGTPIINPMTASDVSNWGDMMCRCMKTAGLTSSDIIQVPISFGLFNGGFGFHFGAEKLGAFIVPTGAGRSSLQLKLMKDLGVTALGAIASYPLRLIEIAHESGFDFATTNLKTGIFGAEVWSDAMRKRIEKALNIKAYDIIGMTETGGVGMGIDCQHHNGIHVWDDCYIVEIIDKDTGLQLADGNEGEMVITTLKREGLPLIRYRTGDITKVISREKCKCGLDTIRVERLKGRNDDMIKVKGVNFYPSQVEAILLDFPEIADNYVIIVEEKNSINEITIVMEVHNEAEDALGKKISEQIYDTLAFHAELKFVPCGTLQRSEGKAKRVIDNRK